MIYSHFFGPVGIKRKRATFGQFSRATKEAAVPLMIPVIIMGGILTGQFTPTEAGIIAVAYIVFVVIPLIMDLTKNADINPVHMGAVIITTLAFGLITPPYGLCLLMAAKFVGINFSRAMVASLPIYFVFFAAIAFTTFFPDVVLWLPKKLLPQSVGCFRAPSGQGYICPN